MTASGKIIKHKIKKQLK